MSNIGSYIMKAFMWVVGIASLGYGIFFLAVDTSKWSQIEAVVVSSKAGASDEQGDTTYDTYYEYNVDGVTYQDSINDYIQYAKGDKIMVYYDPYDPSRTITSQSELWNLGCIGVLFGLFVIGSMAWGAIKARRKTETPAAE